jgi:hypothetical protein
MQTQQEIFQEITETLQQKGYIFEFETDYNNTIILKLDNKLFFGEITITNNSDCSKWFKLKNNDYEKKFNLDCRHIGESLYIDGHLPDYNKIERMM